jgi:hypothetical protein
MQKPVTKMNTFHSWAQNCKTKFTIKGKPIHQEKKVQLDLQKVEKYLCGQEKVTSTSWKGLQLKITIQEKKTPSRVPI